MKHAPSMILLISFFSLASILAVLLKVTSVYADISDYLNATIKVSICGNEIAEAAEDCDNLDLRSKTCTNLGYASGTLACDISCSFDTSNCVAPSITPTNVLPDNVSSLLAAGLFSKPSTDSITAVSSLTTTTPITINISATGGTSSVVLPKDLVITRVDGANLDPITLATSTITTSSLSGFSQSITVDGALQWGIADIPLQFSTPATLSIYVGTSLNGQTLNIVRSTSASSGWTSDGIVSPATCVVSAGLCTFTANKASYFATNRTTPSPTPTPTPSPGSSSSTSTTTSSSSTSTSTTQTTTASLAPAATAKSILPRILQMFYIDESGKIRIINIFSTVKIWVDAWKETILSSITSEKKGTDIAFIKGKCDVNDDGECNLKDLSILLYYVER